MIRALLIMQILLGSPFGAKMRVPVAYAQEIDNLTLEQVQQWVKDLIHEDYKVKDESQRALKAIDIHSELEGQTVYSHLLPLLNESLELEIRSKYTRYSSLSIIAEYSRAVLADSQGQMLAATLAFYRHWAQTGHVYYTLADNLMSLWRAIGLGATAQQSDDFIQFLKDILVEMDKNDDQEISGKRRISETITSFHDARLFSFLASMMTESNDSEIVAGIAAKWSGYADHFKRNEINEERYLNPLRLVFQRPGQNPQVYDAILRTTADLHRLNIHSETLTQIQEWAQTNDEEIRSKSYSIANRWERQIRQIDYVQAMTHLCDSDYKKHNLAVQQLSVRPQLDLLSQLDEKIRAQSGPCYDLRKQDHLIGILSAWTDDLLIQGDHESRERILTYLGEYCLLASIARYSARTLVQLSKKEENESELPRAILAQALISAKDQALADVAGEAVTLADPEQFQLLSDYALQSTDQVLVEKIVSGMGDYWKSNSAELTEILHELFFRPGQDVRVYVAILSVLESIERDQTLPEKLQIIHNSAYPEIEQQDGKRKPRYHAASAWEARTRVIDYSQAITRLSHPEQRDQFGQAITSLSVRPALELLPQMLQLARHSDDQIISGVLDIIKAWYQYEAHDKSSEMQAQRQQLLQEMASLLSDPSNHKNNYRTATTTLSHLGQILVSGDAENNENKEYIRNLLLNSLKSTEVILRRHSVDVIRSTSDQYFLASLSEQFHIDTDSNVQLRIISALPSFAQNHLDEVAAILHTIMIGAVSSKNLKIAKAVLNAVTRIAESRLYSEKLSGVVEAGKNLSLQHPQLINEVLVAATYYPTNSQYLPWAREILREKQGSAYQKAIASRLIARLLYSHWQHLLESERHDAFAEALQMTQEGMIRYKRDAYLLNSELAMVWSRHFRPELQELGVNESQFPHLLKALDQESAAVNHNDNLIYNQEDLRSFLACDIFVAGGFFTMATLFLTPHSLLKSGPDWKGYDAVDVQSAQQFIRALAVKR